MGKGCDLHDWGKKLLANWDGFYEIKKFIYYHFLFFVRFKNTKVL
jgi:hypothetical protein